MSYDLKKLVSSVGKDPAAIRSLAEKIVSGEISSPSNKANTLKNWAKTALVQLEDYDAILSGKKGTKDNLTVEEWAAENLDKAYSWITGESQPTKAASFWKDHDESVRDLEKDIANEASNLANAPERDKAKLSELSAQAEKFGIDPSKSADIVQNASGDWISRADSVKNDETEAAKNLTAKGLEAAERQATVERDAGIATNVAGGSISTPENTAAAAGTDVLSQQENDAAEALSDALADSDLVYMPKVTNEDIDGYIAAGIESAKTELDPYYSELIARSTEAYQQAVTYEADARALQKRQEEITAQSEFDAAQSDLEARGATFSGEAAQLLGEEAALPEGLNTVVQGLLQEQQGLLASSSAQRYQQQLDALTVTAEEQLGTEATQAAGAELSLAEGLLRGLGTPTAGSIAAERTTAEETRGREIAQGEVVKELATSEDFPTEDLLSYI